jgi:hypothetical protein
MPMSGFLLSGLQQPQFLRALHCLTTAVNVELGVDIPDMRSDSDRGHEQLAGHRFRRQIGSHQRQDLSLAFGQGFRQQWRGF